MFATVVFSPRCASKERNARSATANKLKMIHASQKPEDEQSAPHLSYLIPRYCGGAEVWLAVWLFKQYTTNCHNMVSYHCRYCCVVIESALQFYVSFYSVTQLYGQAEEMVFEPEILLGYISPRHKTPPMHP
jgi:hypothetical protein